jgi:hypothetical protein
LIAGLEENSTMTSTTTNGDNTLLSIVFPQLETKPIRNLYVIQGKETGNIKVGGSIDTKKRVRMMQVSHSERLILLAEYKGLGHLKRHCHYHIADYRLMDLTPLWFSSEALPRLNKYLEGKV